MKSSGTISASRIQAGGRSSSRTSATGLNTLKWCRRSGAVQTAITVSSGGQPGSPQATSATVTATSSASLNRARVHVRTRSRAARWSGPLLMKPSMADLRLGVIAGLDPAIHPSRNLSRRTMDPRVKPGGDRSGEDPPVVEKVLAAVRVGPSKTEIREYPMPDIPADAALMKMEVAGICGTDVKLYKTPPTKSPVIMGHENIGIIAKAGREFTRRKGFKEGDLVFVEHYVACGKCEWCHLGQYRHCENTDWRRNPDAIRYGYTSAEKAPHLWGGFAH